jgi:hypothetical protein
VHPTLNSLSPLQAIAQGPTAEIFNKGRAVSSVSPCIEGKFPSNWQLEEFLLCQRPGTVADWAAPVWSPSLLAAASQK